MEALIVQLMTYIALVSGDFSQELGYDASMEVPSYQPSVSFVSPNQLSLMKFNRPLSSESADGARAVRALYLYGGSIYLEESWDIESVADQSILLHELVHYMQDMNYLSYECEGDQERLAYYIQEKWLLEEQGLELYATIGLSPLAMVAAMMCPPNENLAKPGEGGP
jgi:hypothetical protein